MPSIPGLFSGLWRIVNYVDVDGGITVNGTKYEQIAVDGTPMYVWSDGGVHSTPEPTAE